LNYLKILLDYTIIALTVLNVMTNVFSEMTKKKKTRTVINLISPIGNTNQRMGVHGSLNKSEVGSGAMEE
jgi:predicted nucleotidyltransferase